MKNNPALATAIASIIVSLVTGLAAWASQRASARANMSVSRLDLEREAYERARSYDTETISRQDREIDELRARLLEQEKDFHARLSNKDHQIEDLQDRVKLLERGVGPVTVHYKGDFEDGRRPVPPGVDPGQLRGEAHELDVGPSSD